MTFNMEKIIEKLREIYFPGDDENFINARYCKEKLSRVQELVEPTGIVSMQLAGDSSFFQAKLIVHRTKEEFPMLFHNGLLEARLQQKLYNMILLTIYQLKQNKQQ